MRSTVPLFAALGLAAATILALAARSAASADAVAPLPSDAATFGFVARSAVGPVNLVEATRAFRVGLSRGPVEGGPAPADAPARAVVRRELARYPESFLRRVHLSGVVFVADLREDGEPIPSLPNVGGLLLLDTGGVESDLVRTIHHEIFHFADLADDGVLSPDPAWERLNPQFFAYGTGGRTSRDPSGARTPGFVSAYAASGLEEDKAETFAFALARPAALRAILADGDEVLAAKVAEVGRRVARLDPGAVARLGI